MPLQFRMPEVVLGSVVLSLLSSKYGDGSFTHYLARILPLGVAIHVLFWSWLYPVYFSPLRKIPTVPGFPLWGQTATIITKEVGVAQREWHMKYGPIIRYYFPFGAERLSIADNDALKHMTLQKPYNYPKPMRARLWMRRILGEGVLLAEGDEHVQQRKILSPAFSTQSIKSLSPWFWNKAMHLANNWQHEFDNYRSICSFEVLDWLNRTTLDIIGQAAFGADFNSLDHPETPLREAYRMVFAFDWGSHIMHGIQTFFPASRYVPSKMNQDMEKSRSIIANEANRIVQSKQEETSAESKDIISQIVKDNRAADSGDQLSFERMRDQVMTFLGAGHDTTATGVAWTLHLLAKHSSVQSRLRDEIRDYFPDFFDLNSRDSIVDRCQSFDVDRLPYLDKVCRESLRYIPPIPMTVREVKNDDFLGGYFIPAGTTVYILANAINRLPQYWGESADKFDPERWDKLPETYTTNAYMTFLQGTRGCIGRKFAEMEMKVILCCMLSLFEFAPREDLQDPEELKKWRLVLRPKDGITLKVKMLS